MSAGLPDNSRILRSFPELRCLHDPLERQVAWKAAWRKLRWRYAGLVFIFSATTIPLSAAVSMTVPTWLGANTALSRGFISGMTGSVMGVGAALLAIRICFRNLQRALREQLVSRGVAVCIKCGYDLQGQTEPRCPECGTSFDSKLLKDENTGATHEQ